MHQGRFPLSGERELDVREVRHLIIAGWTGRDTVALERHIAELEKLGVRRPATTPIFYHVAASLLTTQDSIEVLGEHSSGEVECVVHALGDGMWVGVGSDHTDRKAETMGISLSKQLCAKPVSRELWRYDDIASHWDRLVIRSFVRSNGERRLYQEGPVRALRPPAELIRMFAGDDRLPAGSAMFCGTLAVHGAIEPAEHFEMELDDPVLGRRIAHRYSITALPDAG
jgi:hypothetical protein